MRRAAIAAALVTASALSTRVAAAAITAAAAPDDDDARVIVLDDGERVPRDRARALPDEPWPLGAIDLFTLRGEVVALQVVVEAGDRPLDGVHVALGALARDDGRALDATVDLFDERFLDIARASGNAFEAGSLAFTPRAAPSPPMTGAWADPLVPAAIGGDLRVEPGQRGAVWIDVTVPADAAPGAYAGALLVRDDRGELASRPISLRVADRTLPYGAAKAFAYYDARDLERRMGDASVERDLRALLHAHGVAAIHEVKAPDAVDDEALTGEAYTAARGYRGPGEGIGDGVFAIGAYGALGEPNAASLALAERAAASLRALPATTPIDAFVYAIDERCDSDWGPRWMALARRSAQLRDVRVGVTCGRDPIAQAADLVMVTARDYVPSRVRLAREAGKRVWVYNGERPFAGPMMLDVPAVDLRANGWIAMRYGVERWFYWEVAFWFDGNVGGRGGAAGYDPFVVAETFHDDDGDWANGDGILVYPGTQPPPMTDYGVRAVFPSVRLKNVRRGLEDAAYVALAREVDRARADAIVRRMIPRAVALAPADARPAWPERGAAWLEARRALASILTGDDVDGAARSGEARAAREEERGAGGGPSTYTPRVAVGCATFVGRRRAGAAPIVALLLVMACGARRRRGAERARRRGARFFFFDSERKVRR